MAGHSYRFHFVLAFSNQSFFHECCQSPPILDHRNLNVQFNRYTGISFVVGSLILLSAKNSTRHWSCYLVVIVAMAVTAGGLTTLYLDQHLIWPILLLWFSS